MMSVATVAAALGGAKVLKTEVQSEFDLASAAMAGLSAEAARSILDSGLLTPEELYELVIPRRTLDRRLDQDQPLTVTESDRLLRATRVIVRAREALGSPEKAATWLRTANRALRGMAPLALLETDIGAQMVERILGRIEHGVYS
jgi:putative toxin-antitoxin system antitoxin component (TIGR02293 family)